MYLGGLVWLLVSVYEAMAESTAETTSAVVLTDTNLSGDLTSTATYLLTDTTDTVSHSETAGTVTVDVESPADDTSADTVVDETLFPVTVTDGIEGLTSDTPIASIDSQTDSLVVNGESTDGIPISDGDTTPPPSPPSPPPSGEVPATPKTVTTVRVSYPTESAINHTTVFMGAAINHTTVFMGANITLPDQLLSNHTVQPNNGSTFANPPPSLQLFPDPGAGLVPWQIAVIAVGCVVFVGVVTGVSIAVIVHKTKMMKVASKENK